MVMEDYKVRLDQFEGPLDLLLFLIRRAEVDVTRISLAQITDQYMKYLDDLHAVDVENAGEFLVTAATLVELKSRLVSPPDPEAKQPDPATALMTAAGSDEGDPAAELIRQLLAYKKIRDAAHALEARKHDWENSHPLARLVLDPSTPPEPIDHSVDLEDLKVYDLIEAFRRIIETVQFDRLGAHQVTYDDTPIELHAEDLMDRLKRDLAAEPGRVGMPLRSIFQGRTRGEMIGLFLATLELVRQRRIVVVQESIGAEIELRVSEQPETSPASSIVAIGERPDGTR
jgi:segregation and condensation protein A